MSTTDPDARNRRISNVLYPASWPLGLLGLASGPVLAFLFVADHWTNDALGGMIFGYVGLSVATGVLVLSVSKHRHPLAIAAYTVAYVGGLFAVLGATAAEENDGGASVRSAILVVSVVYGVTTVLVILYFRRMAAVKSTMTDGVDTTATVTAAGVDGMVNYVQHQRLTLTFTDQNGTQRWLRIGRTGGGYSVGDTLPLRYNPDHPGAKRSIVVGG